MHLAHVLSRAFLRDGALHNCNAIAVKVVSPVPERRCGARQQDLASCARGGGLCLNLRGGHVASQPIDVEPTSMAAYVTFVGCYLRTSVHAFSIVMSKSDIAL